MVSSDINFLDYLKIFPDAFPKSASEMLLGMPHDIHASTVTSDSNQNIINPSYRITNNILLPDEIIQHLTYGISNFWESHLKQHYQKNLKHIEKPQLLYYNVGGKYDVHNDSEDFVGGHLSRIYPRDVTILAYLNDDYEGGELEFPDYGISIKPKSRMVITFPSYYEFQHRVKPVLNGERFTLTTWIETDERIYERPYELGRSKQSSKVII